MKKYFTAVISFLILNQNVNAFVAGPSTVNAGESYLNLATQLERGTVEPNSNRASYQTAKIDITKLKYTYGLEGLLGSSRSNLYAEYGSFTSAAEQVGATLFHNADSGSYLTVGLAIDLVHELDKQFGFYLQASPSRTYNKDKFSNPRIDTFAFGVTSAFDISDNVFQKNLIHYGSGDGSKQNSYLAVDTGFGFRLNHLVGRQFSLLTSLFLEADTSERFDAAYDAAFSPAGTTDRIRAFKYGTVVGVDVALTEKMNLNLSSLQKLGGYDARSTLIYNAGLGYKF